MTAKEPPRQRRGHHGKFVSTMDTAKRQARAAQLFADGFKYREIAAEIGIDLHTAYDDVQAAMRAVVQQPGQDAINRVLRNLDEERARLSDLRDDIEPLMRGQHVTVSQGRVVYGDDGDAVPDDEFTLKVADRLMRIDAQLRDNDAARRRLLGLDAPVKVDAKVTDALKADIDDLLDQMASLDAQQAQQDAAKQRG